MQLSWVHEGVRGDGSGGRETGLVPIPSFVGHKLKMRLIASRNGSNYSYSECSGDDRCHCCSLSASKDSLETSILEQHPRHFATHQKRHLQSAHSTQGCLLKPFAFFALLLPNNTGAVTQAILGYIQASTLVSPLLGRTWIAEVERSDKCDNELRRVQETRKRFTPAISFPSSLECGKSF